MSTERIRIATELTELGYARTTYDALGIKFDSDTAEQLVEGVNISEASRSALEVVEHIPKNAMTIVQDPRCLELGKTLIKPVVKALFCDRSEEEIKDSWKLFGLNRYQAGGDFGPHRDDVSASVLVVTVSGSRQFDLYKTDRNTKQVELTEVEDSFMLTAGSVMILDGDKDPGHAVADTTEASVVAVADANFILRNLGGCAISIPFNPPSRDY